MEDSEFYQRYADKIRQAGAPDHSDDDWERLSPALDMVQKKRWRMLPLWWLGVLSGLLLVSNIGWWWMWQRSEKNSEALRAEWQQIRQETVSQRDTIRSKVVVYQYDTIYRTLVYRTAPEGISGGSVQESMAHLDNHIDYQHSNPSPSNFPTQTISADTTGQNQRNPQRTGVFDRLPIKPAFLKMPERHFKLPENDLVQVPQKRARTLRLGLLIPRKFRLGAGGGLVIPRAAHLGNSSGYSISLNSEIAFSEQLALTLEGAYNEIGFMGNEYDEKLGLPPEVSPGDDYTLKYFKSEEGLKPIVQLSAGMRYWLRATHRLSPYLGLGYAMQWHLPFELQLEYINQVTGQEKERSVDLPAYDRPVSLLDLNAGVRYRFMRHLYLQAGWAAQFKIDANQPGIPRFWGIKSSVLYAF